MVYCYVVKEMFLEAGIDGKKMNHSLQVAGATICCIFVLINIYDRCEHAQW